MQKPLFFIPPQMTPNVANVAITTNIEEMVQSLATNRLGTQRPSDIIDGEVWHKLESSGNIVPYIWRTTDGASDGSVFGLATDLSPGIVQPDGETIKIDEDGVISAPASDKLDTAVFDEFKASMNFTVDVETKSGMIFNGKPVYAKIINCGYGPNAGTKIVPLNIPNLNMSIGAYQHISGWAATTTTIHPLDLSSANSAGVVYTNLWWWITSAGLNVSATNNWSTYTIFAEIWYQKTTD